MSLAGSLFRNVIRIYRRTLKPFGGLHTALYALSRHVLIPLLEWLRGFRTMADDPLYFRVELLTEGYERDTVRWVRRLVKPGMTALDIGAHVGYYTRLFSSLVGSRGRVLAFEPNPRTFSVLERNVQGRANVRPVQAALTDREGTAVMYDFLPSSGEVTFYYDAGKRDLSRQQLAGREISPRVLLDFPETHLRVTTATLDSYWSSGELPSADFIKMDIEGSEMKALQGMKGLLGSSPHLTMIMEYYPRGMELIGVDPLEALRRLRDLGFGRIAVIEHEGLTDAGSVDFMTRLVKRLLAGMLRVNILCVKGA
jgi:FkbM family methyltransferase